MKTILLCLFFFLAGITVDRFMRSDKDTEKNDFTHVEKTEQEQQEQGTVSTSTESPDTTLALTKTLDEKSEYGTEESAPTASAAPESFVEETASQTLAETPSLPPTAAADMIFQESPPKDPKKENPALARGKLSNPSKFFNNSYTIKGYSPLLEKLKGKFHGKIVFFKGKKTWLLQINSELYFDQLNAKYKGRVEVKLLDEKGKTLGQAISHGTNPLLQANPDYPQLLIIATTPNSFVQLSWDDNRGAYYTGYFYQQGPKKKYFCSGKIDYFGPTE